MKEITRIITYAKTLAEDMRNDYSFEAVEVLSVQESIIDKK